MDNLVWLGLGCGWRPGHSPFPVLWFYPLGSAGLTMRPAVSSSSQGHRAACHFRLLAAHHPSSHDFSSSLLPRASAGAQGRPASQSPEWPQACRGPCCDGCIREALFCLSSWRHHATVSFLGSSRPFGVFPLPYQSGSSGEVSGRRWGTCPAGCRWGNRCIPGWRPVSAGGPGSRRCPAGRSGAVTTASSWGACGHGYSRPVASDGIRDPRG